MNLARMGSPRLRVGLFAVDPISKFLVFSTRGLRDDQSEIRRILPGRDATAADFQLAGWQDRLRRRARARPSR